MSNEVTVQGTHDLFLQDQVTSIQTFVHSLIPHDPVLAANVIEILVNAAVDSMKLQVVEAKLVKIEEEMIAPQRMIHTLNEAVKNRVVSLLDYGTDIYDAWSKKYFSWIGADYRIYFKVPCRRDTKLKDFDSALKWISEWIPDSRLYLLKSKGNEVPEILFVNGYMEQLEGMQQEEFMERI